MSLIYIFICFSTSFVYWIWGAYKIVEDGRPTNFHVKMPISLWREIKKRIKNNKLTSWHISTMKQHINGHFSFLITNSFFFYYLTNSWMISSHWVVLRIFVDFKKSYNINIITWYDMYIKFKFYKFKFWRKMIVQYNVKTWFDGKSQI